MHRAPRHQLMILCSPLTTAWLNLTRGRLGLTLPLVAHPHTGKGLALALALVLVLALALALTRVHRVARVTR